MNTWHKLMKLLKLDLSLLEHRATSRRARLALRQARILLFVGRRLILGHQSERAAALTYLSMLSIIPLLAVVFSLFKAFGGFAEVEKRAQDYLLEYIPQSSDQVASWLSNFMNQFRAGTVGVIGMVALLLTVILTLSAVETALNNCWGLRVTRSWATRLVVYWTLLTVAPLLLGASLAFTATLQSSVAVSWMQQHLPLFGMIRKLFPVLTTGLAFTGLYLFLPAARVRFDAALSGGFLAAALFEIAKWLYAVYASRSISANALYGSLAAIPVFIIWLNYSWRIVLFGADVVHAVQYASTDPSEETDPRTNQASREEAAVRVVALIARAFARSQQPPAPAELSARLHLPAHLVDVLCQHLIDHGLLRENAERRGGGLVPARPLEQLRVSDVVAVMRHKVGVSHWATAGHADDDIDRLLQGAEREATERLAAVSWADLAAGEQTA